jgi:hypothetical protein
METKDNAPPVMPLLPFNIEIDKDIFMISEKVWYELSPVFYSVVSCIVMLMFNTNHVAAAFAYVLLCLSVLIGAMRIQTRFSADGWE